MKVTFRPHIALRLALSVGDHIGASFLHRGAREWVQSLRSALLWSEGAISQEETLSRAIQILPSHLDEPRGPVIDASLLALMLRFWTAKHLPFAPLETLLTPRLSGHIGTSLAKLLLSPETTQSFPNAFSSVFYLSLTEQAIASANEELERPKGATRERLWEEIVYNIMKTPEKTPIVLSSNIVTRAASYKGTTNHQLVVFSCGHAFPRRYIYFISLLYSII